MNLKTAFITRTREDLFDMTRLLMGGLEPAWLQDAKKPVLVSVHGTYGSGKKIIPDAAVEYFLGSSATMRGMPTWDEYYTGTYNGKPLEIDFINDDINHAFHSMSDEDGHKLQRPQKNLSDTLDGFLKMRQHGGLSFVHNSNNLGRRQAAINIYIEQKTGHDRHEQELLSSYAPQALRHEFNALSGTHHWARYVEITLNHRSMLQSPRFREAFESLDPADELMSSLAPIFAALGFPRANASRRDNTPHIYGVNIAVPKI